TEEDHRRETTEGGVGGLRLNKPMIDVHSLGAGGGSIARLTASGSLPVRAGWARSEPGPGCYDRRGGEAAMADAPLVLGHLGPDLLEGELRLHRDKAYAAIAERIAGPLHLSVEAAAHGMLEILHNTFFFKQKAAYDIGQ